MKVNQLNIKEDMSVSELMEQFNDSGVLGAGRIARASNLLVDMINDEDMDMTGHDIGEDKRRQDNEKVEEVQAALHARLLEARERIEQNARRA